MMAVVLFLAGLGLLIVGAELIVRGAAQLAKSIGVSPLVLGITIVAIGTSAPELAVGITACIHESGSLAVGNIAGTNAFNILFILGLSALLQPLSLHLQILRLELPVMVAAAVLMIGLAWDGRLTRADGAVLLGAAIVYTLALIRLSRRESRRVQAEFSERFSEERLVLARSVVRSRALYTIVLVVGLAVSVLGANWLVNGAIAIARDLGVTETMIGLTIVAIGTSAPELVTTIVSTIKDERDVAIGNLLGSSIYNILVILGVTCLASPKPIPVERELLLIDIPLMTCVALLCVPVFVTGKRVSRFEGALFLAVYMTYMVWNVFWRG